ncbi:MAG: AAA family ATPase [Oscillospiraceae bacterium]|jgi:cytidylate kinase|nr:AAA family ATPase [Oscillospiraceae bacterium]
MVIGIFGESCTGKSTIASELSKRANVKVYTGKDYSRLAKNEEEAKRNFAEMLRSHETAEEVIVYVISEKEHLALLPERAVRILVTAELDVIKERFTKRMNGHLPAPVAAMLEQKHGLFDDEKHDLHVKDAEDNLSDICDNIIGLCP